MYRFDVSHTSPCARRRPALPELAPRLDTLAASLVPAPPSKRSVQSFGEARRPLLAGESVKVFVPSINRRRMTSVPRTPLLHPAMTEPSTCAKETVSWAGAGWSPRRARASLHPFGLPGWRPSPLGHGSLSSHEDGGTWRTMLGYGLPAKPRDCRVGPPCQGRPHRPPSWKRSNRTRCGAEFSVRLTVRAEEKVIDLVSRRDRLSSAPFTTGSRCTPCVAASRRAGRKRRPEDRHSLLERSRQAMPFAKAIALSSAPATRTATKSASITVHGP